MLIGVHTSGDLSERIDFAKSIARSLGESTRIFNPRNYQEYAAELKAYKPKTQNLILTSTHFTFSKDISEAEWRACDLLFDQASGSMWGEDVPRHNQTFISDLTADPDLVVKTANYLKNRHLLFKKLSSSYFGRVSTDPHTLIVGFMPSYPNPSNYAQYFLRALPDEKNENRDPWWLGVAYTKNNPRTLGLVDWLSSTNIVTVGDSAHDVLSTAEISHAALPELKHLYKKDVYEPDVKLGRFVREISRTGEDRDERNWRNS